jgi:hypothetical protein
VYEGSLAQSTVRTQSLARMLGFIPQSIAGNAVLNACLPSAKYAACFRR